MSASSRTDSLISPLAPPDFGGRPSFFLAGASSIPVSVPVGRLNIRPRKEGGSKVCWPTSTGIPPSAFGEKADAGPLSVSGLGFPFPPDGCEDAVKDSPAFGSAGVLFRFVMG